MGTEATNVACVYSQWTDSLGLPVWVEHRILKTTARQIVVEPNRRRSDRTLALDRQKLEQEGSVYHRPTEERYYRERTPDDPAERSRRRQRSRIDNERTQIRQARNTAWMATPAGREWERRYYCPGSGRSFLDLLPEKDAAIEAFFGPEPTAAETLASLALSPNVAEDREWQARLARGESAAAIVAALGYREEAD